MHSRAGPLYCRASKNRQAIFETNWLRLPLQQISMQVLDEHTRPAEFEKLLAPLLSGHDTGVLSEAGCPAVADPGAGLVRLAHQKNIRVVPLVGPSSILLALMASGLTGQRSYFTATCQWKLTGV